MQGFIVDLDELAWCRKIVQDQAEQFDGIAAGLGPNDVNASLLGTLPAATKLARASQDLHTAARAEFSAAQEFLGSVGQGLGEEGRSTSETEIGNADALRSAWTSGVRVEGSICRS